MPELRNALTPGTRVGVYEVTALIGSGGMGEVYRARDTKLNRDVALKGTDKDRHKDREKVTQDSNRRQGSCQF